MISVEGREAQQKHKALREGASARWGTETGNLLGNFSSLMAIFLVHLGNGPAVLAQRGKVVDMAALTSAQLCQRLTSSMEEATAMALLVREMVDTLLSSVMERPSEQVH